MRSIQLTLLTALVTLLAGCQSLAPRSAPGQIRPPAVAASSEAEFDSAVDAPDGAEPGTADAPADAAPDAPPAHDAAASRAVIEEGTGEFIDRAAASRVAPGPIAGDVTFNFEGEAVQAVIKAILGDFLQENYEIAPGVQGTVTFSTSKPINAKQARGVLDNILQQNNLAMVYKNGRYIVVPIGQAIPGNLTPRLGAASGARGYEVRVVPLKYIAATEMEKILAPFVRQGSIVRADNARSMMLLAGTGSDLQSYLETIEIFDVDWLSGMSVGVYPLERVEATVVVPELEKIFGDGAGTPLAGMFRFMAIERMNAVLVITPQPKYLTEAQRWLKRLDRGGGDGGAQLYVYYVKNVKATDLADNLTEIFTGSRSTRSTKSSTPVGGVVPGVESVEITSMNSAKGKEREKQAREQPAPAQPYPNGVPPPATGGDGIAIVESDDIRISAIEESNALLIRATPGQYDSILSAIKRLDTVPLQVHIEARILQVDLTGGLSFGVQWFFENKFSSSDSAAFRVNNRHFEHEGERGSTWNSYAGTIDGASGLAWTFLNTSAEALISALSNQTNTRVLAAPSLVVLNNKEASFNVGKQIPVVSTYYNSGTSGVVTNPSTGTTGFVGGNQSSVQFRDTGIILSVTPRVNPGGLVYLELKQENSTPGETTDPTGNVPVDKTEIETEIAVQSGETVLLGGLIKETEGSARGGVPGLMSVPVLGRLFGSSKTTKVRQEILILITPTVIQSAQDARDLTNDYRHQFEGLKPLLEQTLGPEVETPQ